MRGFCWILIVYAIATLAACANGPSSFKGHSGANYTALVQEIFKDLDDRSLTVEQQLQNYAPDAVILVPDQPEIRGTDALRAHLSSFGQSVHLSTTHEIVELKVLEDMLIVQGRVVGTAQPEGDPNTYAFETKNIILLKRESADTLKIWKVIYNATPVEAAALQTHSSEKDIEPNIFSRFSGVWTLKDDLFEQVWDTKPVETLTIPNHLTRCDSINTDKSVLCIVDAGDLKGHIFWAYDDHTEKFRHLSHFGSSRLGAGSGGILPNGNLQIKISFSDEPEGTHRVYEYIWVSADEYKMMSRQFDAHGTPTGNWYGGTFVRFDAESGH